MCRNQQERLPDRTGGLISFRRLNSIKADAPSDQEDETEEPSLPGFGRIARASNMASMFIYSLVRIRLYVIEYRVRYTNRNEFHELDVELVSFTI